MPVEPKIVYCRCAYAQVVPPGVKGEVLQGLCQSDQSFESVADLCEMAAHRDPRLGELAREAGERPLRIAACFPRAVRGLFLQAECPLPASAEVVNMRETPAADVLRTLLAEAPTAPEGS